MNKILNIFKPLPLPLPWSGYQCSFNGRFAMVSRQFSELLTAFNYVVLLYKTLRNANVGVTHCKLACMTLVES